MSRKDLLPLLGLLGVALAIEGDIDSSRINLEIVAAFMAEDADALTVGTLK